MQFFKSMFNRNQNSHNELTLLEKHTNVAKYAISTHLIAMGERVDIFEIDGSPMLPYMNEKMTNKGYECVLLHHIPIVMYNALSVADFPEHHEIDVVLNSLEIGLRDNMHNPWVMRLVKSYEHNRPIKKEDLFELGGSEAIKYEIARNEYESRCGRWVKEFEKICKKKNVKKSIIKWFNEKYNCLSAPI